MNSFLKKIRLLIFLIPLFSFTQNIKGIVLSEKENLSIKDANISLKSYSMNSKTDDNGEFKLRVPAEFVETDSISFTHVGYVSKTIVFSEFKKNNFLIYLEEKIESLPGISIQANKPLKSKIAFTKLKPSKYPLFSFGSILKDSKIYVIGGDASFATDAWKKVQYEKVDPTMEDYLRELSFQFSGQYYKGNLLIYDIKTNTWETSKLKFRKRAYHNLNEYNNKIYVLGGKRVSANGVFEYLDDKIEVFDPENQSIIIDNTNPHQAADFASFEYNGNLIVMGGSTKMNEDGVKIYSNKVHSYNINSGYWYELDNLPTAKETTGVLIKNKIYLVGGFNSKPLNTIESFDLITEKWTTEGELFKAVSRAAITNDSNLIYFFDNERIYTLDTNTRLLKEYQIDLPLQASKLFYSEDKLYVFGGYIENYYSKYPSPILISIDVNEFKNTKPIRTKFL